MKNIIRVFVILLAGFQFAIGQNQVSPNHPDYDRLKAAGLIHPELQSGIFKSINGEIKSLKPLSEMTPIINYDYSKNRSSDRDATCNCFQQVDSTFQIAPFTNGSAPEYRNDDGSTALIQLPFSYCLYGDSYNSCFINNNGNVSFNQAVGTFSSAAFPNASVMVAPFWADVDTRGATSGLVHYKITEHYLVVIWDNVGYYNSQTDKKNSFQLIISDGTDPIVPFGNNTAFCYGDMQWTTGSASQGVGGFGGFPATSGANRGNSINFIQFGQFGQAGGTYQGPFGNNSGIDWLDNRSFFYSSCTDGISTNVPPVLIASTICETAYICVGSQVSFELSFFAVEEGQNCTIEVSPADLPGLTIVSNTVGNISTISGYIDALPDNIGPQSLTFTVTDDGDPAGVTQLTLPIAVVDNNFVPEITSIPDSICEGQCATLSVGQFDTYLWSNGETTPTIQACSTTEVYSCHVTIGTCAGDSDPYSVPLTSIQAPVITGNSSVCQGLTTTLTSSSGFATYSWSGGLFGQSINVGPGTYILTAANSGGCSARDTFIVQASPGPIPIIVASDTSICVGQTTQLAVQDTFMNYSWTNSASIADTAIVSAGDYVVTVTDSAGCIGTGSFTVIETPNPAPIISGNNHTCFDEVTPLTCTQNYAQYLWSSTSNQSLILVNQGNYTVTVTDNNGCSGTSAPFVVTNSAPQAQLTGIADFCEGDSILIVAGGNFPDYLWYTTPDGTISPDTLGSNDSLYFHGGLLTLEIHDAFGCEDTINVNAPSTPHPLASFSRDPSSDLVHINTPIQFTDTSVPNVNDPLTNWDWNFTPPSQDFTQQNPLIAFPDTGVQTVTLIVTSDLGCSDTASSTVYIVDDPFVPNAISPDGDGINDFLKIPFLSTYPKNTLVIFNRWGKKVYEVTDYLNNWDGGDLPAGTYFYVVRAPDLKEELKGSVTILRK